MKKTIEALEKGITAVKPGNTADDVAQAFWKILDKYGIDKKSRTGYSIGIGYPPDWGEHTLNIYKGDMTVLEPNVCFHMIAVMQFGNWGVEASEAIRVTDQGSELFCNFSKETLGCRLQSALNNNMYFKHIITFLALFLFPVNDVIKWLKIKRLKTQ